MKVHNNVGQVIGEIKNETLYKKVLGSKHFHKVLNSYGIDKKILDMDFELIKILDKETGQIFVSEKESWLEHGITKDFGFGEQVFLPLKFHEITSKEQLKLINA